ncbi:MAG: RNA-binding protein [Bacteroidota bacterium]
MNLFVGNLHPETNANALRTLFSEFGEIVSSKVIHDNATGASRGFGFVEMADKFQAYNAIDNLDSTFFEGNIISVKEAKQNSTKPGGAGGNSGGNRTFNKPRTPRPGGYNTGNFNNDRY